jgi:hypothetical protein
MLSNLWNGEPRLVVFGTWTLMNPTTCDDSTPTPRWPSPAYSGLTGNVLPRFLSFSGNPFPAPSSAPKQPFPDLVQTQAYLLEFSRPLRASIRLNIEVVGVDEIEGEGAG